MPLQSASRRAVAELVETSKTAATSAWASGSLAAITGILAMVLIGGNAVGGFIAGLISVLLAVVCAAANVIATVTDRMVRLRDAQLADELSDRVAN